MNCIVHGVAKCGTQLSNFQFHCKGMLSVSLSPSFSVSLTCGLQLLTFLGGGGVVCVCVRDCFVCVCV